MNATTESNRLQEAYSGDADKQWLFWGPYLSERQWGTVREDYSAGGNAWDYFSHDQARSRAYRWGEDGLAGLSDPEQRLCFALALWNGQDPILKERLFGLTNSEGNHGEDVKEYYYYLDNTPSHSYMKWLYKYPQRAYPYADLVNENARRKADPHSFEYELMDTGVFADSRYFDVQVEYAKNSPTDVLIKISVTNHGPDTAFLQVLPTLWFRNTWSWYLDVNPPSLQGRKADDTQPFATIESSADTSGETPPMKLYCKDAADLLFVDNETNNAALFGSQNKTDFPKDGINDHVVKGQGTVRPELQGTKASATYQLQVGSQQTQEIHLRLSAQMDLSDPFGSDFDNLFPTRIQEADEFYHALAPDHLSDEERMIQRQAYAGMLWGKQYYYYVVADWLKGDPATPPPPPERSRNKNWSNLYASNILSMPDTWEYPWFAEWDLCFQAVVLSRLDTEFAKEQLLTLAHEWYMSPNGAIPAYEWAFSDINPPLLAWAALRIFDNEKEMKGGDGDFQFLDNVFQHCLLNFTWWANQVSSDQKNLFEGGFLGLDNISVINRSSLAGFEGQIGKEVILNQSDGTSWMGMFCLNMMEIAMRLYTSPIGGVSYEHLAVKFFQHFVFIADAMNSVDHASNGQVKLWNDTDGFYYDFMEIKGDQSQYVSIQLRSLVGVIALFPVMSINTSEIEPKLAATLKERIQWFFKQHPELIGQIQTQKDDNADELLLAFADPERLVRILVRVLDENEFLSPHGIRGISRVYLDNPYTLTVDGATLTEQYTPAESTDYSFGGNSNWRGPVWFPINFMLIETLKRYHDFLGDDFKVEYPAHSGQSHTLLEIANDLSRRLISIFQQDGDGNRPVFGGNQMMQKDPNWKDHLFFYEYFHGDNGAGLGASHQTGWTGLVAELLNQVS